MREKLPLGRYSKGVLMSKNKRRIQQAEVVRTFATKLRETRISRGLTQADLAEKAQVTPAYVSRLESAGAAPGVDLVDRLAKALGTTLAELLVTTDIPDAMTILKDQAKKLLDGILKVADRDAMLMLNPLLARLSESFSRSR
jgi:transcriptional regulator with XRE-family HTH domain